MLVILSDAFRKGDSFLKQNKRKNVSALILAGGWIESMHFDTLPNLIHFRINKCIGIPIFELIF